MSNVNGQSKHVNGTNGIGGPAAFAAAQPQSGPRLRVVEPSPAAKPGGYTMNPLDLQRRRIERHKLSDMPLDELLASATTRESDPVYAVLQDARYALVMLRAAVMGGVDFTVETNMSENDFDLASYSILNKLEVAEELYGRKLDALHAEFEAEKQQSAAPAPTRRVDEPLSTAQYRRAAQKIETALMGMRLEANRIAKKTKPTRGGKTLPSVTESLRSICSHHVDASREARILNDLADTFDAASAARHVDPEKDPAAKFAEDLKRTVAGNVRGAADDLRADLETMLVEARSMAGEFMHRAPEGAQASLDRIEQTFLDATVSIRALDEAARKIAPAI